MAKDIGMMFGRDDLRVLEASAGAVREQLNARAAAASDTPMNPFKAILGGAQAAAQIKKQADAANKMAKANGVNATWTNLVVSKEFQEGDSFKRVNLIESFWKDYADDEEATNMAKRVSASTYTKSY